jgi:hypothetical protein
MRHRSQMGKRVVVTLLALVAAAPSTTADIAAVALRVNRGRAELARLLTGEGVEGRFLERNRGSYSFAPAKADLPEATVANPGAIGALAAGPRLRVRGTLDELGRVKVSAYSLPITPELVAGADVVAKATRSILATVDDAIRQPVGAMPVESRELRWGTLTYAGLQQFLRTLLSNYQAAMKSGRGAAATRPLALQWANVRGVVAETFSDSDEYKAIYGPFDNYPPWRYEVIFQQSPAAVAIAEPGRTTSVCSGVLLADDLVLTAAHCFSGPPVRPPTSLEVWFGYVDPPDGYARKPIAKRPILEVVAPGPARLPDLLSGRFGASLYDYAVVRIGPAGADGNAGAIPQCLRREALHKGDPIYVVGYPRGSPAMVHDSARVYLPYRVYDGEEFLRLRLEVEADLLDVPERAESMDQFDQSYDAVTEGGIQWRLLRYVRDGGQPRMGIVADTFRGDSGAPVFDRDRYQCVVGVLVAGAPDTGQRRVPNWKEHERVLPISAILDDLESDPTTARIRSRLAVK